MDGVVAAVAHSVPVADKLRESKREKSKPAVQSRAGKKLRKLFRAALMCMIKTINIFVIVIITTYVFNGACVE